MSGNRGVKERKLIKYMIMSENQYNYTKYTLDFNLRIKFY